MAYTGRDADGNTISYLSDAEGSDLRPFIVYVGKATLPISSFARPADTTAYAAGDVICNSTSAPTAFTIQVGRIADGLGLINHASLSINTAQSTKLDAEVWLFDAAYATANDNAAWTPSDNAVDGSGNLASVLAVIPFGNGPIIGNGNVYYSAPVNRMFKCASGTDDIYWALVARNAYTPTSGEIYTLRLACIQY